MVISYHLENRKKQKNLLNTFFSKTAYYCFRYQEYRLFWIAALFSNIGMWSLVYGRLWLMRTLTDSEIMLGLVITANLAPILLFSLFGGIISDKHNRLQIVRSTRLLFALVTLITGILIQQKLIEPWHVISLSIFTGTFLAIDIPARSAMIAKLIPKKDLPGGIVLYSIIFGGSAVLGPLIFAPIVSIMGLEYLFYMIALSYIFTVITLYKMDSSLHVTNQIKDISYIQSLYEGFRYLGSNKNIHFIIILGIVVGLFSSSFEILLPVFTDEIFYGDSSTYSRLLLFLGLGGLFGTFALSLSGAYFNKLIFLIFSTILFGFLLIIFSTTNDLSFAILIIPFIGMASVWKGTINTTMVQTLVEENFRGRTMSMQQWAWGSAALGGIFTGFFAQNYGAPKTLILSGILIIFSAIFIGSLLLKFLKNR